MDMNDLIAKLEKATGPDRELDAKLAFVNGAWAAGVDEGVPWVQWAKNTAVEINDELPRYTASIDAALALVPDGLNYVLRSLQGNAEARVGGWKDEYQIKDGRHPV